MTGNKPKPEPEQVIIPEGLQNLWTEQLALKELALLYIQNGQDGKANDAILKSKKQQLLFLRSIDEEYPQTKESHWIYNPGAGYFTILGPKENKNPGPGENPFSTNQTF